MPYDDENQQDLLAAIRRERALLDELLAGLSDEAMLAAARNDGWTAKDMLAHITVWEQRLLAWIGRWLETGEPNRPDVGVTWDEVDTINERDFQAAKVKTTAVVRRVAQGSYEAVVRAVGELSDDELAMHPEADGGPSWSWIVGANTHEHYQEHREEMEAWWQEKGG